MGDKITTQNHYKKKFLKLILVNKNTNFFECLIEIDHHGQFSHKRQSTLILAVTYTTV